MIRIARVTALAAVMAGASLAGAQTPANDPSARLRQVLPADVAQQVLDRIAAARQRELPAAALEHRALKFAAKGVAPREIARSIDEQADRMEAAKAALEKARARRAAAGEIEAGAEAMRQGVDGAKVAELAKSAPSGRSLEVPLYVIGSLVERGLASDEALKRVQERLTARATDAELEKMPGTLPEQAVAGQAHRPAQTGRDLADTKRPGSGSAGAGAGAPGASAGRPATLPPAAGGSKGRPVTPGKPVTPSPGGRP